jgi:glycosyltransferase involved in cell wall biosynthesis
VRILTVATSYPRHPGDWAGRFVRDLNAGLVALGHEVTTLAPDAAGAPRASGDAEAGDVVRVGLPDGADALFYGLGAEANARRLGPLRTLAALRGATLAFERAIAAMLPRVDLVLAHWLFPCAWWAAAAPRSVPLAGVVHGADARLLERPVVGRIAAARLRGRLDAVACVSARAWDRVRRRLGPLPPRAVVTPMGVDASVFGPDAGAGRDPALVAAAGRLVEGKGFDLLLRACAGLPVRAVIAGEGPEAPALARLARALGVALDLPGVLEPRGIARLFRSAAVVAVPSRGAPQGSSEGIPLAAIEALSCGAAVVATRAGGLPEILAPHALVPASERPLREALAAALAEPERFRDPSAAARYDRTEVARRLLRGIGA